jgi:prevent-host-death family protein
MKHVQASAAKMRFAELLDQVERGEVVVITRHGKPIARLVPDETRQQEEIRTAIAGIRQLRQRTGKASLAEILQWRDEGRR